MHMQEIPVLLELALLVDRCPAAKQGYDATVQVFGRYK